MIAKEFTKHAVEQARDRLNIKATEAANLLYHIHSLIRKNDTRVRYLFTRQSDKSRFYQFCKKKRQCLAVVKNNKIITIYPISKKKASLIGRLRDIGNSDQVTRLIEKQDLAAKTRAIKQVFDKINFRKKQK